ncbi:MAG: thioredoxin family protein [Candidatus Kapaibacterium sp.]|nr:thioredoxin family protein [Bacteroidota bacterium]
MKFILSLLASFTALVTLNVYAGGYKVGDVATDFSLKNVDGKMVSLKDIQNTKGFIVVFTCNHCPYSVAYEDRIIALHNEFAGKGYPVVAINPNDPNKVPEDSFEKMIERSKAKKFPFMYLLDGTQDIAKTYGASRTPHVFLLVKKGNDLVVSYIGAIDDNTEDEKAAKNKYVESAVQAVIAGKTPSPDFTKAIGCGIKWSGK